MRKVLLVVAALLTVGALTPAHANPRSGSVVLPTPGPAAVREAYNRGIETNLIGVVFKIPPGADGKTYTLTKTSGFGNLDVDWYADDNGRIGQYCGTVAQEDGIELDQTTETGTVCPNPNITVGWAIVTLRWGFNAFFTLSWA